MNIEFENPLTHQPVTSTPAGLMENGKIVYPLIDGVTRIASNSNYTESFGFQWNQFVTTQIDKYNNLDLSKKRFFAETGWDKEVLKGKKILEVGSGAGRFSQVVLDFTDAELYSIDYSNAVDANFKNNGSNPRLHLFQASIYEMPFAKGQFDKVFCFGVLQHTPDVRRSILSLADMVKPGGELVVDFYPYKNFLTKIQAKYILRPFTRKMDHTTLFNKINRNIGWLIKTYKFLSKIGLGKLNRFLPICDINGTLPANLSPQQLRDMCVLDTFDMFSPEYDQPQKIKDIITWFKMAGLEDVWGETIKYENFKAAVVKGFKRKL